MKSTLVIICVAKQMAAWQIDANLKPVRLPLQKQELLQIGAAHALAAASADLSDRLQGCEIRQLHWLCDADGRKFWAESLSQTSSFSAPTPWQLLGWEWVSTRLGLAHPAHTGNPASPWNMGTKWVENELLPWLLARDDAAERDQLKAARLLEHQNAAEKLAAERAQLQQNNLRLREENAALRQVDAERLVTYLPALFARVFTVLGASDLSLLCGRVEPLHIPNPYPEPSEETLRTLQKDFLALPRRQQQEIVDFITRLPQRQKLQPRPEMRSTLSELEHD